MVEEDYPLLNYPDLMDAVLRVAAGAAPETAGLDDARDRLLANLRLAREEPRMDMAELQERLSRAQRDLLAAGVLKPAEGDRFHITERGRQVLAEHPRGVDSSVLMEFPEFRSYIHDRSGAPPAEALITVFDAGYAAYAQGLTPIDNPYDFDTNEHLAWENGWFEARDETGEGP